MKDRPREHAGEEPQTRASEVTQEQDKVWRADSPEGERARSAAWERMQASAEVAREKVSVVKKQANDEIAARLARWKSSPRPDSEYSEKA
jgi:hypothetical protein